MSGRMWGSSNSEGRAVLEGPQKKSLKISGLCVHMRRMHPNEYHQKELEKLEGKVPVKKRLSEEEVAKMALVEARLTILGDTDTVNQEILKELPDRTIEGIKGKRRPQSYKQRVEDLVKALLLETLQPAATTEVESPIENEADITIRPRGAAEENEDDVPDDPLRDLDETLTEEVDYHLEESTIIYECIEKYVDALNTDQRLRPIVGVDERTLLDVALYNFETDPTLSKELINTFLSTIIKPQPQRKSFKNRPKPKPQKL